MFGNLGAGEIVILMVIVLLVFGAKRLPEAGKAVGKGLREFKRALSDAEDSIQRAPDEEPPRDAKPKRLVE
jgi:sec-independent protein translocase protein TatA